MPTHLLKQQPLQLMPAVIDPLTVGCVNDPYKRVRLLEIVLPIRPQRLLAAHIPYIVSIRW